MEAVPQANSECSGVQGIMQNKQVPEESEKKKNVSDNLDNESVQKLT